MKSKKGGVAQLMGVGAGAVAAVGTNMIINKVSSRLPAMVQKFVPLVKVGLGAYLLKSQKGIGADMGYGFVSIGFAETASQFMPSLQMSGIAGPGDLYQGIGAPSTVLLPVGESVDYNNIVEEDELVASAEYDYEYEDELM